MFMLPHSTVSHREQRYQQAIESAALRAATELSEIVINDPYFGFISLSDQKPIGQATFAADGEPLPVHGINTIIATTRLDYLIAKATNDQLANWLFKIFSMLGKQP